MMNDELNNKCVRHLGVRYDYLQNIVKESSGRFLSANDAISILDAFCDDIIDEIVSKSDLADDWDSADVCSALGNVVMKKLGIKKA